MTLEVTITNEYNSCNIIIDGLNQMNLDVLLKHLTDYFDKHNQSVLFLGSGLRKPATYI